MWRAVVLVWQRVGHQPRRVQYPGRYFVLQVGISGRDEPFCVCGGRGGGLADMADGHSADRWRFLRGKANGRFRVMFRIFEGDLCLLQLYRIIPGLWCDRSSFDESRWLLQRLQADFIGPPNRVSGKTCGHLTLGRGKAQPDIDFFAPECCGQRGYGEHE